jgi:penicillin amidase
LARFLRYLASALLLAAGLALVVGWWLLHRPLPELDGSVTIPELHQAVLVDRDQHGVPRIRADSLEDLVTAQGYVMAQDRLWQMDLLRRVAAGDLAEIFGPGPLDSALQLDRENRTLGLREAADRGVLELNPDVRVLLDAYSRGVNRYIQDYSGKLPLEFTLLRYSPRPWTPADTLLINLYMWKSLTSTWKSELNRASISERVGPERAKDLYVVDSPLDHFIVGAPAAGGKAMPSAGISELEKGDTHPAEIHSSASSAGYDPAPVPATPPSPEWIEAREFLSQFNEQIPAMVGSNNWVVNGSRTYSGKPLLANDPHLGLGVPCIWYMVHLESPGFNAEGFDLPGTPLLIIGHNDRIAWGFTNNGADVQDLYIETFNPTNPLEYRVNGAWVAAKLRHEVIHVKGRPDDALDVFETRHGPIVRSEGVRAYALRWTATQPGAIDFGYPLLSRAKNWSEFRDVMRHVPGPAQNAVYADVDGNIGFIVAARIPIRKNGDGSVPVPGDTDDYEWTGYIPFDDLPQVLNPPEGIIATANARTVGPGYHGFLTNRWLSPYRTERIYELLENHKGLKPEDFDTIQTDILSLPDRFLAEQLVRAAQSRPPGDPRARECVRRLAHFDGLAKQDSVEVSFLEYTRHMLFQNLLKPYLGSDAGIYEWWDFTNPYESVWLRDKVFLENVLRDRPAIWLPHQFTSYDDLLMASADQAVAQLQVVTRNSDRTGWHWGEVNPLFIPHPLARSGFLRPFLSIGPMAQSGSIDTVKAMGHGHGPSMRFVADLSNFDNSLMEITTGESGQYGSPYYQDQFDPWYQGRALPAPFSDAAETKARVHRLRLLPSETAPIVPH